MKVEGKEVRKEYVKFFRWLLPILLIIAWYVATKIGSPNSFVPSPIKVMNQAITMLINGQLLDYTAVSTRRAVIGLLIGGGIGFLLGLMNGIWKITDITLNTTIQLLKNIPVLALLSLMVFWLGNGEKVKLSDVIASALEKRLLQWQSVSQEPV